MNLKRIKGHGHVNVPDRVRVAIYVTNETRRSVLKASYIIWGTPVLVYFTELH